MRASESSRTAAMSVLARSGRLPQLIEAAREQLTKTPNSVQIYQALADYYVAARQNENARITLEKLVELRKDDAALQVQVANRLTQIGQAKAALDHYRIAFKRDPAVSVQSSDAITSAFLGAGRHQELLELLNEVDLRSFFGSGTSVGLLLARDVPREERFSAAVVSLFRKAWDSFPEDRAFLFSYTRREEVWRLPDTYELARESIIPSRAAQRPLYFWYPFLPAMVFDPRTSQVTRPISRFLDLAAERNRFDELAAQVESAQGRS